MVQTTKIIVCGMPRSRTTWIFNIVRELLRDAPVTLWIEPNSDEEPRFASEQQPVLAKCHHYSELIANSATLILYSYRDIRTAAVSYQRRFGTPSMDLLEGWVIAAERWLPRAHFISRYEDETDDRRAIDQLRK